MSKLVFLHILLLSLVDFINVFNQVIMYFPFKVRT